MPSLPTSGCFRGGLVAIGCCLLALTGAAASVLAFYQEEDARGAAAWKRARSEIMAQGISLDPETYYPTVPPEERNFGALPLFDLERDPDSELSTSLRYPALISAIAPLETHLAYKNDSTGRPDLLPYLGKWSGGPPDLVLLRTKLAGLVRRAHPGTPPAAGILPLIAELCPALGELRAANPTHPLCVFPRDYHIVPMSDFSFAPETSLIRLGKALAYEERIALYEHQPQLALDDLAVGRKVEMGLEEEPFLVCGLVAIGIKEIQLTAIQQGLAEHDWNDRQLAQLDSDLGHFDVLSRGRFWMAGDIEGYAQVIWTQIERHPWSIPDWALASLSGEMALHGEKEQLPFLARLTFALTPQGWYDLDKAADDRYHLVDLRNLLDPAAHRVYEEREAAIKEAVAQKRSWLCWSQPIAQEPKILPNILQVFAFAQVRADEARIACRLERFRLLHGSYPTSPDLLKDSFGGELPCDVMDGKSYRYKLRPDGSYLLYSVGWNQEDDQGMEMQVAGKSSINAADWVWLAGRTAKCSSGDDRPRLGAAAEQQDDQDDRERNAQEPKKHNGDTAAEGTLMQDRCFHVP